MIIFFPHLGVDMLSYYKGKNESLGYSYHIDAAGNIVPYVTQCLHHEKNQGYFSGVSKFFCF